MADIEKHPADVGAGARTRANRLGTGVVRQLVELIVTGRIEPRAALPREADLCDQFQVSRTVLRESIKRLEEKGLVVVAQGRGTHAAPSSSWNMLDPEVLTAMINNDDTVGVLDELTVVRASLEAAMAGQVAAQHTKTHLLRLHTLLATMREAQPDEDTFYQADVAFHYTLMDISGNRLAQNIAKSLYRRALDSPGQKPGGAMTTTLQEHTKIVQAIVSGDTVEAERAMRLHIETGWQLRRLSSKKARPATREGQRRSVDQK